MYDIHKKENYKQSIKPKCYIALCAEYLHFYAA